MRFASRGLVILFWGHARVCWFHFAHVLYTHVEGAISQVLFFTTRPWCQNTSKYGFYNIYMYSSELILNGYTMIKCKHHTIQLQMIIQKVHCGILLYHQWVSYNQENNFDTMFIRSVWIVVRVARAENNPENLMLIWLTNKVYSIKAI